MKRDFADITTKNIFFRSLVQKSIKIACIIGLTSFFGEGCKQRVKKTNATIASVEKNEMKEIIDEFIEIYGPVVENIDINGNHPSLKFIINEKSTALEATATQHDEDAFVVLIHQGLLDHNATDQDVIRWVICHEIGHHLGGLPNRPASNSETIFKKKLWSAAEGQADYYANLVCMKKLLKNQKTLEQIENLQPDPLVVEKCSNLYSDDGDISICVRSTMAGYRLLTLIGKEVDFKKPKEPSCFGILKDSKPPPQCRLETILAGSLCRNVLVKEYNEDFFVHVMPFYDCENKEGKRPVCWYDESVVNQ